ncbi:hypothetical protein BGW39_000736 [Mortierella sp. 14UC]|nr:hypothetical protein BGW39_000736 [Mortierella sp. 14UC]
MKFLAVATAVVSTLLLTTSNVEAHVTANPSLGVSGAYFQTNFRVPHGCEGNATDLVIVEIPEKVTSVKPRATYPWNTTINMIPLAVPITTPTGTVNTTIGSVTWSNGALPDAMYEDFGLHTVSTVPGTTGPTSLMPTERLLAVITVSNATTSTTPGAAPSADGKNAAVATQILGLGQVALVGAGALLMAML